MKLEKLVNECIETLQEEAGTDYSYWYDDQPFEARVESNDGYIELFYKRGDVEVEVFHNYEDDLDHPRRGTISTNLQEFLADALHNCVDWNVIKEQWRDDAMDVYQRNGFNSEADFWHWKEGR